MDMAQQLDMAPPQEPTEYQRKICIAVTADNQFEVYDEVSGPGAKQAFGSVAEALGAAEQLLTGGQPGDQGAKQYWDQLAAQKDTQRAMG